MAKMNKGFTFQGLTLVVALLSFSIGTMSANAATDRQRKDAIDNGIDWLLGQSGLAVDGLWLLKKICEAYDGNKKELLKAKYEGELKKMRTKISGTVREPYMRLLDKNYQFSIDDKQRSNFGVFDHWLVDVLIYPETRRLPEKTIQEIFFNEYEGYYLTHQLLALVWLRERNYPDTYKIEKKIREHAHKIVIEQARDPNFSDIFSERAALILYAGFKEKIDEKWINTIVNAQKKEGFWRNVGHKRGKAIEHDVHTSLLALWALVQYDKYKE